MEGEPGPSWARPNWPLSELDEINLGLDPLVPVVPGLDPRLRWERRESWTI